MRTVFFSIVGLSVCVYASAYTWPVYSVDTRTQVGQAAGAAVGAAPGGAPGGKCGSFGWNLDGCSCNGATAVCSVDPANNCRPQPGLYNIAYLNVGRCVGSSFTQACGGANIDNRLPASDGGWNEAFVRFDDKGIARYENMVSRVKALGFQAIEPDNTAELFTPNQLEVMVKIAEKYGMKMVIKNENEAGRGNAWGNLLQAKPELQKNIAMVLAEDCNDVAKCTGKYGPLAKKGIPVVMTGHNRQALEKLTKDLKAAALFVPNVPQPKAVGVSKLGEVCVNENGLTPGTGPTPEQLAALSQGMQPYQQTRAPGGVVQSTAPGAFANGFQPGNWGGGGGNSGSGSGGGSSGSGAGGGSGSGSGGGQNYNPGGNPWTVNDFNRLQPTATPSFLDPTKSLGPGSANPYAKSYFDGSESAATKDEVDSLFGDKLEPDTTTTSKQSNSVDVSLRGTLSCTPKTVRSGERATIAWRCPLGSLSASESTDAESAFSTKKKRFGTTRVPVYTKTTYTLFCEREEGVIEPATCTVDVRARTAPAASTGAAPRDPNALVPGIEAEHAVEKAQVCFLGFCL